MAQQMGMSDFNIGVEDALVQLTPHGLAQATAVGRWFAAMQPEKRPTVVLSSPYLRAQHTAERIIAAGGIAALDGRIIPDDRFREQNSGCFERLTPKGIEQRFPREAELQRLLGRFHYRPPGGENWCDVIVRLCGAMDTIRKRYSGERVLIVTHKWVILCLRYLLESRSERETLTLALVDVPNCSLTSYVMMHSCHFKQLALKDANLVVCPSK
jgi:broad specificity phosphatase PhoE